MATGCGTGCDVVFSHGCCCATLVVRKRNPLNPRNGGFVPRTHIDVEMGPFGFTRTPISLAHQVSQHPSLEGECNLAQMDKRVLFCSPLKGFKARLEFFFKFFFKFLKFL